MTREKNVCKRNYEKIHLHLWFMFTEKIGLFELNLYILRSR